MGLGEHGLARKVRETIDESVEGLGFRLVLVRLTEQGKRTTLQLMIERADGSAVNIDECADVSRHVSALLDVHDVIHQRYDLEVGSPGMDRPLMRPEDFIRHRGRVIKLQTVIPQNGQRRFKGRLVEADEAGIRLQPEGRTEEEIVSIGYEDMETAKLIVTEDQLRESLRRSQEKT